MNDLPGVERVSIKRTVTTQKVITRPPRSAKAGCALLVFFLVLASATLVIIWLQFGLLAAFLDYPPDQWPALAQKLITDENRQYIIWGVVFVLGSAVGLPIAAYLESEDFLVWLKQ